MVRFHTIVTHEKTHVDEYEAIRLLRKFGEVMFPGISTAKVIYWKMGGETPDGRSAEDYERDGVLLVGVGGGRFDEHPTVNVERKAGECAATLVAKALGVQDDPALAEILKYVVANDLKGGAQPFDIASLAKLMHQQHPDNPEMVMEWVLAGLEAKYQEQFQFWTSTKEDFERNAQVEEIATGGKLIKIVSIISDGDQISKFARSEHGGYAAVVIQKRLSGNVQIYTNKRSGVTLYDVAQMLRLAEQEKKGHVVTTDWDTLSSEGKVAGAEEWFFHKEGQMILNGSLTATGVSPTKLSLEEILDIIRIGLNPALCRANRFQKDREKMKVLA
ncbi:MAG: hypothetical protein Q7S28_00445 [bacterium]|nr:hypothetical protein [bacterium]